MTSRNSKRAIEQYDFADHERVNNPPVGLVTPDTDPPSASKKTYAYDPHLDPQLVWAGKAERPSFDVPTVPLHVHERIDPHSIIEAVLKRNGDAAQQLPLFETPQENPPIREAIEFYQHRHNWSNRLIAGDSLLVMSSLLEKEGMGGQVQMVYIDPPYGIKYGSNFQPFTSKRDVTDGRDIDLTQEPEMIQAFRDTWELGVHSYLTYLRDRFVLARELLTEAGSIFVQIGEENIHLVRSLMDEVFASNNAIAVIPFRKKTMPLGAQFLERMGDYLLWYARDSEAAKAKYRQLYLQQDVTGDFHWDGYELPDGTRQRITASQVARGAVIPEGAKIFRLVSMWPPSFSANAVFPVHFRGKEWWPPEGQCWPTNPAGMEKLFGANRLEPEGRYLRYVLFLKDYDLIKLTSTWSDTIGARDQEYVVETSPKIIERCILMTTDPGDVVLDPTCGSGTTAYVAEQWGRRWVTCDTSRIAVTLAKQRVMTAVFPYYELAHPDEGVSSGFNYRTLPHITLKTIANSEPPTLETLYDQPQVASGTVRITGPFTVEAVPAPVVASPSDIAVTGTEPAPPVDGSVVRSGETARQRQWRDQLLHTGIRGKGGQRIEFSRLEALSGTRYLHAEAETKDEAPVLVAICFGPEHAPLEQRQVAFAIQEAQTLVPLPKLVVFAAFQFDPEAAKDIDETHWPGVTLLKVQMNTDLLTDDLKKKRASNDGFWLIGQPDVDLRSLEDGHWKVEVHGFDYFDTRTGELRSGGPANIAMWLLDTDYDGRSLYPRQVFFPMGDDKRNWTRLVRTLKAEIDPDLIGHYRGTVSLPFEVGPNKRIAVKIVDDRGIESLKVMPVP